MSNKIAIILNDNHKLTALEDGAALLIFRKEGEAWTVINEIPYSLDISSNISDIRENIQALILKLEDCKIIVGKTITGLSYNSFDRMGFEIFEADSVSEDLFEYIEAELNAGKNRMVNGSSVVHTGPVTTSEPGVFFLDLIQLQEKHPEISSKKALQTFICTNPFYRLDVVCSHIPPWFDVILPKKKLNYKIKNLDKNRVEVSISQIVCQC